jgi:hypothetical protein
MLYIIAGIVALLIVGLIVMLRLGGTVQAAVYVAINRGEYQFIALMEPGGEGLIFPKVEGIPDWYLEVTCFAIQQTTPETREADLEYMQQYNDTMYQTLKDEGKLHLIEEDIEKVGRNLGKLP